MLKVFLLALFITIASCARLELVNTNQLFTISVSHTDEVKWELNGESYAHLAALSPTCANGATPVSLGEMDWTCGPFDSLLSASRGSCNAGDLLKAVNGTYVCESDSDVLKSKTCSDGQVLKFNNSTGTPTWDCAADGDLFASGLPTGCPNPSVLQYTGSAWQCVANPSDDSDLLAYLPTALSCTGKILKFTGGNFTCGDDSNTLPTCSTDQILKYDGTTWNCGADSDLAISLGCSAATPYFKYRNSAWTCQSSYFLTAKKKRFAESEEGFESAEEVEAMEDIVTPPQAVVLHSHAVLGTNSTTAVKSFKTMWGVEGSVAGSAAAVVIPVNGTINSFQLVMNNFNNAGTTNVTVFMEILVNGATVSNQTQLVAPGAFSSTYLSPLLALSFNPGDAITSFVNIGTLKYTSGQLKWAIYLSI